MNDNPIMLASAIGFQFVRQYYTVLNKDPSKLHCFYKKPSHFTHGEEGARSDPVSGQHDINSQIIAMEFTNPKVVVSQLDAQPSSGGGVVVMVVGEMSNKEGPSRRFCQTFFLAAEETERYYVLNDIFRYLKESEPTLAPVPTPAPAAQPEPTPEPEQVSAPESVPEPTPEPEQAPVEEEKVQEEVPSAPEPVVEETQAPKETQQVEPTPAASEQTPAPSQPAPPKAWGNPRSNQPQGNPSPSNKPAPSETHETRGEKPDVSAFLANVTPDMESEIRAHFGQFGDIARVSFLKGSTAAFIDFKTVEQAEAAISAAAYTTSKGKQIKAEKRAHPKSQGHSNENGQRRDNYRDYRDYRDRDYQGGYSRRDQGYQNGSRRDDRDQRERRPQNGSSSSQSSSSRPYNPQPTSNRKPASAPAKN